MPLGMRGTAQNGTEKPWVGSEKGPTNQPMKMRGNRGGQILLLLLRNTVYKGPRRYQIIFTNHFDSYINLNFFIRS